MKIVQVALLLSLANGMYAMGHFFTTMAQEDLTGSLLSIIVLALSAVSGAACSWHDSIAREFHEILDTIGWERGRRWIFYGSCCGFLTMVNTFLPLQVILGRLTWSLRDIFAGTALVTSAVLVLVAFWSLLYSCATHIEADVTYRTLVEKH